MEFQSITGQHKLKESLEEGMKLQNPEEHTDDAQRVI